jgi:hypothetical protein
MVTQTRASTTHAVLVIYSEKSHLHVARVAEFLNALEEVYNGLLLVDRLLSDFTSVQDGPRVVLIRDKETGQYRSIEPELSRAKRRSWRYLSWASTESLRSAADLFDGYFRLRIHSIEIASPGFWAFLGSLNIFETMRKWAKDAHTRRQDIEYGEKYDEIRLQLENEEKRKKIEAQEIENRLNEMKVLKEQVSIAKEIGATDEELRRLLQPLVVRPLKRLEQFTDVIDSVEVREIEDDAVPKQ